MKIIKDNLHLLLLATVTCISVFLSTSNYSSQPEESKRESTAQAIRERYLDFYYWMEALSRAPLMLVEHDYSKDNAPLTLDDLKRIYNLSFTASHLIDPVYFSLRNAYYSSNFQDGKPFDMSTLDEGIAKDHSRYLDKLHEMHRRMSPYYDGGIRVGSTFTQVNQQVLIPAYEESYQAYKQWMVQYSPSQKPYDPKLGEKRAEQWLRYEIADQLLTAITPIIDRMESQREFEHCIFPALRNFTTEIACLEVYAVHAVKEVAAHFLEHSLLKKLMPDVHASLDSVLSGDAYELHTDPAILFNMQQRLQNIISRDKPPYGLAYFPVRFSIDKSLEHTGMDLHKFASLPLESLEILKADIQTRRKTVSGRAITPEIAIRELGMAIKLPKQAAQ